MKSLVVEDDRLSGLLLHAILRRFGRCDIVENGREAVVRVQKELTRNAPYDLMCLDIVMPVLDGQEALEQIRTIEKEHGIVEPNHLKVIMVTAIEDFDTIARAFEIGRCEGYLIKPLKEDELLEHLYELELV